MKKLVIFVLVLVVAVGALGYWRGWFTVTKEGKVEVQVDSAKFKQDRDSFSKSVGEKAKALKDQVASLWEKSEGLTGDESWAEVWLRQRQQHPRRGLGNWQ